MIGGGPNHGDLTPLGPPYYDIKALKGLARDEIDKGGAAFEKAVHLVREHLRKEWALRELKMCAIMEPYIGFDGLRFLKNNPGLAGRSWVLAFSKATGIEFIYEEFEGIITFTVAVNGTPKECHTL